MYARWRSGRWSPERPFFTPAPYDVQADVKIPAGAGLSLQLLGDGFAEGTSPCTGPTRRTPNCRATWICYRTDSYPTDPTDGTFVADLAGAPNAAWLYSHTAAPLGTTIYYAAFSHDSVRHFSPASTATVTNGSPLALPHLSSIADGRVVNVEQLIVTGAYQNCFYVENEARTSAIQVDSTQSVSEGDIVTVLGNLGKTGHERSLAALGVTVTGHRTPILAPFALKNASVGGADKGQVPGSGGIGLNNVGMLVRMTGTILNPDPGGAFFYISDGSSTEGIKVKLTGGKTSISIPTGEFFTVTGISSLDADGSAMVWPRSQGDIVRVR